MHSFSPVLRQGAAIAKAQVTVLQKEGVFEFLRTSPDVALEFLGFILLDSESILMDSSAVQHLWKDRTGDYSPDFYANIGPDSGSKSIRMVLDDYVDSDAAILELGCSVGRHLSHLHEHGYEDLHGIEINDEALEVMAKSDPDLAADGTFYLDTIETVVPTFENGQFDVVFSYETLELLHPDNEWVFAELARITDSLLITVENEGEDDYSSVEFAVLATDGFPFYVRKYNSIFTDLGFQEIFSKQLNMDMLRVFQKPA